MGLGRLGLGCTCACGCTCQNAQSYINHQSVFADIPITDFARYDLNGIVSPLASKSGANLVFRGAHFSPSYYSSLALVTKSGRDAISDLGAAPNYNLYAPGNYNSVLNFNWQSASSYKFIAELRINSIAWPVTGVLGSSFMRFMVATKRIISSHATVNGQCLQSLHYNGHYSMSANEFIVSQNGITGGISNIAINNQFGFLARKDHQSGNIGLWRLDNLNQTEFTNTIFYGQFVPGAAIRYELEVLGNSGNETRECVVRWFYNSILREERVVLNTNNQGVRPSVYVRESPPSSQILSRCAVASGMLFHFIPVAGGAFGSPTTMDADLHYSVVP